MPTVTKEPQTERETVVFHSKSPNQVLTRRPSRAVPDEFGGKVVVGEAAWFKSMQERKEDTGEDFDDTPWRAEFQDHIFKTDHPKLIAWLRQHSNYGLSTPGGFFEAEPAPEDLKPTVAEQRRSIMQASVRGDVDTVIEIRDNEKATHNRPEIVEAAVAALEAFAEEPSESEAAAGSTGDPPSTSAG